MSQTTSTTSLPSTNSSSDQKSNPESTSSRPPLLLSERIAIPDLPPPHHVLSPAPGSTWSSYLPHWNPVPEKSNQDQKQIRTGFCNPWPSAHKPTPWEVWENLEWGVQQDAQDPSLDPSSPSQESQQDREQRREEEEKLQVTKPDFSYDSKDQVKTTWLGHAGVLLQLPPIGSQGSDSERPVRVLFDPIFSERCSPTQLAGPIRSYPAPCSISDLPPIDVVVISHSHYDHLDYNTIYELWNLNSSHLRFIVPLGNKSFFTSSPLSVPEEQVTELDWWDEVLMTSPSSSSTKDSLLKMDPMNDVSHLRLVCTPAQHGSGRIGLDANTTLWASWTLEYHSLTNKKKSSREPFRIFFGGDTGYQFQSHQNSTSSSSTSDTSKEIQNGMQSANGNPPVSASASTSNVNSSSTSTSSSPSTYPVCPAFQQIASRLGAPHLLLLPISVGATISFLKSFDPIPPAWSPFPRIDPELNSSNHMGPEDAVRVMNLMTKEKETKLKEKKWPVAVGIHWGTFVSGENEVKNSIRGLRSACEKRGVRFSRESETGSKESKFVLINHGQSISQSIL